jgi:hypothetical protein
MTLFTHSNIHTLGFLRVGALKERPMIASCALRFVELSMLSRGEKSTRWAAHSCEICRHHPAALSLGGQVEVPFPLFPLLSTKEKDSTARGYEPTKQV